MKKLACLLLACFLLMTVACSGKNEGDNQETNIRMQFTLQEYPIPDIEGLITAQCVSESQILIGVEGEQFLFGRMNFDGSGELSVLPAEYNCIYAACVVKDGTAVLTSCGSNAENTENSGELTILLYDGNNKLTDQIALSEQYDDEEMNFKLMLYTNGYFLLMSQSYLIRINEDGTENGRISREDDLTFSSMCLYDDVVLVSRGELRNSSSQICSLNMENFTLREEFSLQGSIILGIGISEDGRLVVNDVALNSVNYLDMVSGEKTELFSWNELGLHMPEVTQILWVKGGYVCFVPNQNTVNFVKYALVADERTEIILATNSLTPELNKLVYRFNDQNEDYKITVVEYNGYDKTIEHLRAEILTGKIPDIYAFTGEDPLRDAPSYTLYEDMLPYLDNDAEFSRESLVPSLLTAFLREDSALRWMPYDFVMFTFIAPVSLVGERTSITLEEAESIASKNDLHVFDIAMDQEWLLSMICNTLINRYIDLEAGICDFENPDFIALLEKCKEHPPKYPDDPGEMRCVLNYSYLFGLNNYLGIKTYNDDYYFVGLPVSGEAGGVFMNNLFNLRFAISAQSENKDAAWEFVRSVLKSENQQAADNFPVVQKELDMQIEAALADKFVTATGSEIKLEQSDADRLRDLIERTTYMVSDDKIIRDIITEEAKMYFADDRTVENTVHVIQSRLSQYVAEQQRLK